MEPIGLRKNNNNDLMSNIHEQTANHFFPLCADYTLESLNSWKVPSDGAWLEKTWLLQEKHTMASHSQQIAHLSAFLCCLMEASYPGKCCVPAP